MAEKKEKPLSAQFPSFVYKMRPSKNIVGREQETEELLELLLKKRMRNALIIGKPGVGKTELVRHVASVAKDCVFYEWDIPSCLSGTQYRGDFEKKVVSMLAKAKKEAQESGKTVILFVDEAHMIMGAGKSEYDKIDLSNMLKSYLANSDVVIWGATTMEEYREAMTKDGAFRRRFSTLLVGSLSKDEVKLIIKNFSERELSDADADYIYERSLKFRWMSQPDASIELADRILARQHRFGRKLSMTELDGLISSMENSFLD